MHGKNSFILLDFDVTLDVDNYTFTELKYQQKVNKQK